MKKNILTIVILFITLITYGQEDFKEIKTKTIQMAEMNNNKPMNSKNIIRIYDDSIVISIDTGKKGKKAMASMNLGGGTTYKVKKVENDNSKISKYKGEQADFTIDYSGKSPKITMEAIDPNTGNKSVVIYL